jgi:hypothetical protein
MEDKTVDRKMKVRFIKFTNSKEDAALNKVMSIKFYRYKYDSVYVIELNKPRTS